MDSNWNAAQGSAGTGPSSGVGADSSGDWRSQLQSDARQRIVNKIMDTLKRHLPVPVPEGLNELQKIAVQFEERIYSAATSQPDYLRKISLKMLSMETKAQPALNASLPNQNQINPATITSRGPSDQSQIPPLQQSLPGLQSQQSQQLQQQLEQMDNHPNQLQPQLNIGTPTQSNSSSMQQDN